MNKNGGENGASRSQGGESGSREWKAAHRMLDIHTHTHT